MQKLKNIEFLRTFLICGIVMLHMFINRTWCLCNIFPDIQLYQNIKAAVGHSNNGVEGFFIIAGFLLVITFKDSIKLGDFVLKKYIRLSPPIAFSMLLCIIGWMLNTMHFKPIANLLTIFLFNNFGICWVVSDNPVLWFTSALFAGLLVYFCLIKFVPQKYNKWIITVLFIIGYLILEYLQHGSFSKPIKNYYHVLNVGFLRALGGLGIGCLIGQYFKGDSEKINNLVMPKLQKYFITFAELFLTAFIIWWMLCPHANMNNILFVLGFTVLFILFVAKKGYVSQFFDKDIWVKLGKYQYSVYVVHYVFIRIFGLAVWKQNPDFVNAHPVIPILVMLFLIILLGVFTYHFVEIPCAEYLKNLIFVKSEKPLYKRIFGGGVTIYGFNFNSCRYLNYCFS